MNFGIERHQLSDERYVISLAGEIDLYTAPEFKHELLEVIARGGRDLIIDMTDTTFVDSTTLGVLVGGMKRVRGEGGQIQLVVPNANVRKIFEITGLTAVFPLHETLDGALAGELPLLVA